MDKNWLSSFHPHEPPVSERIKAIDDLNTRSFTTEILTLEIYSAAQT